MCKVVLNRVPTITICWAVLHNIANYVHDENFSEEKGENEYEEGHDEHVNY